MALLSGLFDYAGLFPPAKLPMRDAVREHAVDKSQEHAWMAARFCCPPARFDEFVKEAAPLWRDGPPWRVAAIGTVGATAATAGDALDGDLAAIGRLRELAEGRAFADALETRVPPDAAYPASGNRNATTEFLRDAGERIARANLGPAPIVYWEFPLLGRADWREGVRGFAASVAEWNARERERLGIPPFALKIRAGGVEPSAFPTPEQIAGFIASCRDAGVAFKATAGLHHPVRHFAESTRCDMHGFLNVFVGAALAQALRLDEASILRVVEERDASAFRIGHGEVAWRDLAASSSEVAAAREGLAISIGSCSFAEPVEDLQALGLLPAADSSARR